MKLCLVGMIRQNLAEMKGRRWKHMNPEFCVQSMSDVLKIILEAKDEDLPKVVGEMREFLCTKEYPLMPFGVIRRTE